MSLRAAKKAVNQAWATPGRYERRKRYVLRAVARVRRWRGASERLLDRALFHETMIERTEGGG